MLTVLFQQIFCFLFEQLCSHKEFFFSEIERRAIRRKLPDDSEEYVASIFKVEE
jgi:hypothetical protein